MTDITPAPTKPGRQFPGVGTGAIVFRDGRLLMIQRAGAHGAGTWSVPGGWVEYGEHPFDGAAREVLEETGLAVQGRRSLGWTDSFHEDEGVHAVTLWVVCYPLAPWEDARVVEPDKCPQVEWVPRSEVLNRPLFKPLDDEWPLLNAQLPG